MTMNKYDNEPEEIIYFDNKPIEAISFIEKDINGKDSFAITKFTNNGKYLRGNLLFYSLNGVEVYTDKENIIFVDSTNKKLFIRKYEEKLNQIDENVNADEDKEYIVLYCDIDDESEELPLEWEAYTGRTPAYEAIKLNLPVIDIDKSIVLTDNVPLKDAISIREFIETLLSKTSLISNIGPFETLLLSSVISFFCRFESANACNVEI